MRIIRYLSLFFLAYIILGIIAPPIIIAFGKKFPIKLWYKSLGRLFLGAYIFALGIAGVIMSFNSAPQAHVAAKVGIGFMPVGTYGIGLVFGLPLALGGLSLILLHIIVAGGTLLRSFIIWPLMAGGTLLPSFIIWPLMSWLFICRHLHHHQPRVVITHPAEQGTCYFNLICLLQKHRKVMGFLELQTLVEFVSCHFPTSILHNRFSAQPCLSLISNTSRNQWPWTRLKRRRK
jgi:hypothetical protein